MSSNPKKRALMPSSKLRKALRGAGHHLSPVVQVGKEGVTEALLEQLDEQLAAHELVKVRIGTESPEDRFEAAERLGAAAGAQLAQILGRTILVYRPNPDKARYEPELRREPPARAAVTPPSARKRRSASERIAARGRRTR